MRVFSSIKPRTIRQIMFKTAFPLKVGGKIFDKYCTYGKRWSIDYLHCLLLGHGPGIYSDVSVETQGVFTTYNAQCCGRRYYPENYKIREGSHV
jgi:hypothetical protein